MDYLLLILGFVLLVKGADFFVEGSSAIARYFKIPAFIIGLTIVAMGTSAPEAAVSISAAVGGMNGIAIGNVLGSNIFNLLVVLGVCAIIRPCPVKEEMIKGEHPLSIIVTVLLIALGMITFTGQEPMHFARIDGIVFLVIFVIFVINMVKKAIDNPVEDTDANTKDLSLGKAVIMAILGLAGIIGGGQLVVNSASSIAASFGISETLIGLTIVAIGTSLPELVTSIAAAMKGHSDIAVGNVIGSNIFNMLFVLGASVTIHPVQAELVSLYDAIILVVCSLLLFIPYKSNKQISRAWGAIFVILYIIYMVYIIMR